MEKLRLIGLENNGNRSIFTFEKTPSFFALFSKILESMNLEPLHEYEDAPFTIDDATDGVDHKENELYDVDIFYGEKHILVVIRSPVPRDQYLHHIKKFAEHPGF